VSLSSYRGGGREEGKACFTYRYFSRREEKATYSIPKRGKKGGEEKKDALPSFLIEAGPCIQEEEGGTGREGERPRA